jgi:2-polyprenyl-3-methyl-5-hydroxy-6-metoxy-1,4-benzoquinol methylase
MTTTIDQDKLMALVQQCVGDFGAMASGTLVNVGDRLGLYRALNDRGPLTSQQLAQATGTSERYVREWLNSQAASNYVSYDGDGRYSLSAEQVELFANEDSPFSMLGGFQLIAAATRSVPRLIERFKTGEGLGWHEHDPELFEGTLRFFRPGYLANLVSAWLPALDGVVAKLEHGARVMDVGCGLGASTIIMAKAFPKSEFAGSDYHGASIEAARAAAAKAGVSNCNFQVASAKDFTGTYDLICYFDCLHDMGDPIGAAKYACEHLNPDGTVMLVEPYANDDAKDNMNPVGRVFYSASTMVCTPASLSQEVGASLGAQAGEARLRDVLTQAGFARIRRATETPFNMVIEARP